MFDNRTYDWINFDLTASTRSGETSSSSYVDADKVVPQVTLECKRITDLIKTLNTTIPLIWVVLGSVTNVISLVVFSRKSMRSNSTFFYLVLMTFSDLVVLWVGSFRDLLAYKFETYISGTLTCRLHVFTFFMFTQFSSWMLTAANLDRLVFVVAHTNTHWCTRRNAMRVSFLVFVILFAFNSHFLLYVDTVDVNETLVDSVSAAAELSANGSSVPMMAQPAVMLVHPIVYKHCKTKPGTYSHFYANYYSWLDSFTYSFVPFFIMGFCNLTLIRKVFSTKRNLYKRTKVANKKNALQQVNSSEENNRSPGTRSNSMTGQSILNARLTVTRSIKNVDTLDRMRNMALTIIGVTALFIIFTVPINIYIPIMHLEHLNQQKNQTTPKCDDLTFCILNNMVNANHSTSFFIYLTTNSKFKNEINNLLSKLCCLFCLRGRRKSKKLRNGNNINNMHNLTEMETNLNETPCKRLLPNDLIGGLPPRAYSLSHMTTYRETSRNGSLGNSNSNKGLDMNSEQLAPEKHPPLVNSN